MMSKAEEAALLAEGKKLRAEAEAQAMIWLGMPQSVAALFTLERLRCMIAAARKHYSRR